MTAIPTPRPRKKKCPICGKPAQQATRPFCSDRCKDLDLHRWLSGAYAIPASNDDEDEDGKPSDAQRLGDDG